MALSDCYIVAGGVTGTLSDVYSNDRIQETYQVELTTGERSPLVVEALANAGGTNPLPIRGTLYGPDIGYGLYARRFDFRIVEPHTVWQFQVSYEPLQAGEQNPQQNSDPLNQAPEITIEYVEYEQVIAEAYNVEDHGGPFNKYYRQAATWGAVTNSIGREFDEGLTDIRRDAVIVVKKNIATEAEMVSRQSAFAGTTNSDTWLGAAVGQLKYLSVNSTGKQNRGGTDFFEMRTRVQVFPIANLPSGIRGTDRRVLNNGWAYYDTDSKLVKHTGSEPINIDRATGRKKDDSAEPDILTYRNLEPVAYTPLGN